MQGLKETATAVQPTLEKIGSVMGWISEKAGGYGNIAKFVGGFYLANKVANWGITQKTVKGGWGLAKWGLGKFRKGKGGVSNDVAGALGETVGVTPVYVTNFPASFGDGYGGVEQDKRKNKRQNNKKGNGKNRVARVTTAVASNAEKAVANKGVTQAVGNTVKSASQSLSATTKAATSAISRTATRAVPYLNVAASAVEGAMVLMDEQSSTQDKSEAIGSIAGATAGAIVGQALIPIPVVGAAVGSYVGSWLGEWLGSEVGEYLSDPEPIKNELNGTIQVAVKASEHLIATATASKVQTNQKQDNMNIAVQMGTLGPGMGMW